MKHHFTRAAAGLALLGASCLGAAADNVRASDIMLRGQMIGDRYAPNSVEGYNRLYGGEEQAAAPCRRRALLEKDFGDGRRLKLKYDPFKDAEKVGVELTISLQPHLSDSRSACGRLRSLIPDREEIAEKVRQHDRIRAAMPRP